DGLARLQRRWDDRNKGQPIAPEEPTTLERGESLVGLAWARAKVVSTVDLEHDPALMSQAVAKSLAVKSGMALPVRTGHDVRAIVTLFRATEDVGRQQVLRLVVRAS